jgi:hypothetical protein
MPLKRYPILVILVLSLVPLSFLIEAYKTEGGLLSLIQFGAFFEDRQLEAVQAVGPPLASTPHGYDGQFYAQIAIDPSLQDPQLSKAVDNLAWRGKRIGTSFLAYCLGMGNPSRILYAYALINFLCWGGLLFGIYQVFGFKARHTFLLAFAVLCGTGTLLSLQRALIDLPALLLAFAALYAPLKDWKKALLLGIAGLFKETALLSAPFLLSKASLRQTRFFLTHAVLLALPFFAWWAYIQFFVDSDKALKSAQLFDIPLLGITTKLIASTGALAKQIGSHGVFHFSLINLSFELLAPIALLAQAVFFIKKPLWGDPVWRWGIGFALLVLLLGPRIWEEQAAYCRILLPLTAGFNLLLFQQYKGKKYYIWYTLANVGMFALALQAVRIYLKTIF